MSDDNGFLISDIDDSEGDELSGEYKHDTIKVPDQAVNSDSYLDYENQKTKKTDSIFHSINEKLIFNKNDEKNNDKEDNSDDENFTVKSDENKEEDENDEDVFVDNSDENEEEKEKSEDEDIFVKKNDEDNENEEEENGEDFTHKTDVNLDEENKNDDDIFVDKSDENEEEKEKSEDEDLFANKNNENNEEEKEDEFIHKTEENNEDKFSHKSEENNEDENENDEDVFVNKTEENNENEKDEDASVNKSDENEEAKRKINDAKNNTNDGIENINESIFNADDEKEDIINEISNKEFSDNKINNEKYRTFTNESNDFADESNEFADESYTGQNESNIPSDEIKNIEENKTNKDDDAILKNKKEKIETNKEDSSLVKPISEPSQQKNENPRSHRHLHKRKKEKIRNDKEEEIKEQQNEETNQQPENKNQQKDNKKYSTRTKNQTKINEEHDENIPSYTIDEITEISINNGDYSLINQSNIQKVMSKIRQRQRDALEVGDYELAKRAQLATQSAYRYYNEKQLLKHNSNRACEINVQLEQTRNDISFLQEHWSRVLENAKQKANDDLLQLRDEQDKIVNDFDTEYKRIVSNPEKNLPFEYRKFSSKVLTLKKKQEIYMNINNFQMAKEINKEIRKLEEKEKKENFLRFQKKKIAERNQIIKKQDEMFAVRKENWMRTIEGIKSVARYEIDHAKKSEKQLETKFIQTNEFSNKLIQQQQQRTSSLQPKKKNQQKQSQDIPNTTRENTKTITHTQFTIQRNAQKVVAQEFRERALINRIIYTNRMVPKVRKPVTVQRTRRQYLRTPR